MVALFAVPIGAAWLVGGIVAATLCVLLIGAAFVHFGALWFQAYMSGADVSMMSLIGMSFRQVKPGMIIARVGQGIITAIGSAQTHLEVMEKPDRISKGVLEAGLDAHTAFAIVSIDISEISVGENIGARLQADQAEADTRMAQANAETRRANAIALQQEMKARVAESRARLVLAEAEIPRAIAAAFHSGQSLERRSAQSQRDRLKHPHLSRTAVDPITNPRPPVPGVPGLPGRSPAAVSIDKSEGGPPCVSSNG